MNKITKKVELVAPAGSFEILESAYAHGADAVYIGAGPFNLRANASGFEVEDIFRAVETAHNLTKKLYLTLNTMPSDQQLEGIEEVLKSIVSMGALPDAVIVSDPGVFTICKDLIPQIPIHLSTQTGTFNSKALSFWTSLGIKRAVLPREFSLEELRIVSNCNDCCETEAFVHGAMCVSISGRCLLGAYMSGRHPNRGDCPQPCRYKYKIIPDGSSDDLGMDVDENSDGVYIMNSKDLNSLSILPQIISTGVSALKIEGRNKSIHYVSSVVKIYREALDLYYYNPNKYNVRKEWNEELSRLDHRPYTTGFYGNDYVMQSQNILKTASKLRVTGMVKAILTDGRAVIDVKNPFVINETLNLLPVRTNSATKDIIFTKIEDINGNELDRALTNRLVVVSSEHKLKTGDLLRRFNDL